MYMKNRYLALTLAIGAASFASAQVTLNAMTSFSGDGWLSPGEYTNFGTDNTRGMALNKTTGNVLIAQNGLIRKIDGTSGADAGTLNMTGVAGGIRSINRIAITDDGQIFATNLTTSISPTATSNTFNVYRWSNESAAPELVYTGAAGLINGARLGDSLDAWGTGSNVQLIAGYGSFATTSTLSSVTNAIARLTQSGPSTMTAQTLAYSGAVSGNWRLGLTFVDGSSFLGTQGGGTTGTRYGEFTGSAASAITLTVPTERAMDVKDVGSFRLLATIDTNSGTASGGSASTVRIYSLSGTTATLLTTANLTTPNPGGFANTNGTGDIKFGDFVGVTSGGFEGKLYALNTNNGIQAFNVNVVPEPATMTALGLGVAAMLRKRRKSK